MSHFDGPTTSGALGRECNKGEYPNQPSISPPCESHTVYELRQQREYFIKKIIDIQKAIDAINQI